MARASHRRTRIASLGLFAASVSLVASCVVPSGALAYLQTETTFADGSASSVLSFDPSNLSLQGPRLRLLTNASVTAAQLTVTGLEGTAQAALNLSGDGDFGAAEVMEHMRISDGRLSLENTTSYLRFDANNSFGGGQFGLLVMEGGRLVTHFGGTIAYLTAQIANTGEGWGYFSADGAAQGNDQITFDIVGQGGALLISNIQPGARIPYTSWEQPTIAIRVIFSHPIWAAPSPIVNWFAVGQRAQDGLINADPLRNLTNMYLDQGVARTLPDEATWQRDGVNPVIPKASGTYRSGFVAQPRVVQIGAEWWMYFAASTAPNQSDADIARAVSTDLENWTIDSAPLLLNGSSGPDAYGIGYPYVLPDPSGSGYVMYYTGWSNSTAASIFKAVSPDGINWTKTGQVMAAGGSAWNTYSVGMVSMVVPPTPSPVGWTMWISASNNSSGEGYVLAIAYGNGDSMYADYGFNPVLGRGAAGTPDHDDVKGGTTVDWAGLHHYYYGCDSGGAHSVCLATSPNDYQWTKVGAVLNRSAGAWDSAEVSDPSPVLTNSTLMMFYSGSDANGSQIGRALAPARAATLTGRLDLVWGTPPDMATFYEDYFNPRLGNVPSTYFSTFLGDPSIIQFNGSYWMYVAAGNQTGLQNASIAVATSPNLWDWSLSSAPVLLPGPASAEAWAVANPFVMRDPLSGGLRMYYTGFSTGTARHLMLATSLDGTNWTKQGEVLRPTSGSWDARSVGNVSNVEFNFTTGVWRMWYSGTNTTTGLGNSIGLATSTDGVNWTKYSQNPLMARAGLDSADLQGGKMIRVDETLYLYYTCSNGIYRVCLASSNDGSNWTKAGAVFQPGGTGFESVRVSDACPVAMGSALILFYTAVGSGGTAQIGRATGVFNPVAARPRASNLPRAIAGPDLSLVAGVQVNMTIRSSSDLTNWSAPEDISSLAGLAQTPVRRYLEYTVTFAPGPLRSALDGVGLRFVSAFDTGRWLAANATLGDPFDEVRVENSILGHGAVNYRLSADGGAAWQPTSVGRILAIDGGSSRLSVEARLFGDSAGTLELERFGANARVHGLPTNLTVSIGDAGAVPVTSGPLNGSVTFDLSPASINAAIQGVLAANGSAAFADVSLVLNSTHFGVVNLSGVAVEYTLKNPLSASFEPPAASQSIDEGETLELLVAASTLPGVPINYSWTLDGTLVPAAGASYTYAPGFFDAGSHWLNVSVENGDFVAFNGWIIEVRNVNREPVLVDRFPLSAIRVSHNSAVAFRVFAFDPDLGALEYRWSVDGLPSTAPVGNETNVSGLAPGDHQVAVEVNDSYSSVVASWTITLTNDAPARVDAWGPTGDVNRSSAPSFRIWARDPDGDALTCQWTMDGAVLSTEEDNATTLPTKPVGSHRVAVTCSDGFAALEYGWLFNALNSPPSVDNESAQTGPIPYLALATFTVVASDADGDLLVFSWTVNDASAGAASSKFVLAPGSPGEYVVALSISDGFDTVARSWTVDRFNLAPSIDSKTPENANDSAASQSFSVNVSDEENRSLMFAWELDGAPVGFNQSAYLSPANLSPGVHKLNVVITDAYSRNTTAGWTFTVPSPDPGSAANLGPLLAAIGIAAAVAVAVLIGRRRTRRN